MMQEKEAWFKELVDMKKALLSSPYFQKISIKEGTIEGIKVGDTVTRYLGGKIPQELTVDSIEGEIVRCALWEFNLYTGAEIDEDLGWDGVTTTGSYILIGKKEDHENKA